MVGKKHGFLAFNDIQSDYYQLPSEDKEKIRFAEEQIRENLKNKTLDVTQENNSLESSSTNNDETTKINSENNIKQEEIEKRSTEKKSKHPMVLNVIEFKR